MKEKENISKGLKKEYQSNNFEIQKDHPKNSNEDAYFIIVMDSKEKIKFKGLNYETDNKIEPIIIYENQIDKENKSFLEGIVFRFKLKSKKKGQHYSTKYKIKFFEEEKTYNISFSLNDNCFAYQPVLTTGNKFLPIFVEVPIKQNIVPLYKKLNV